MDIYDREVERLTAECKEQGSNFPLYDAWVSAAPLFQFATHDGKPAPKCGCLTMVRAGFVQAATRRLTEQIRGDKRIPKDGSAIRVRHLKAFAQWQRIIDKRLRRTVPSEATP